MGKPFHEVREWSSAEISLFAAYYRIAPWGEERADIRNAMTMAQTANMHRDTATKPQPFEIGDFMPFSDKPEPDKSDGSAGMRDMFKGLGK